MSWSSGSELAEKLWETVREAVPPEKREAIAQEWVKEFEQLDCDNLHGTQLGEDAGVVHDEERGSHWPWEYKR